MKTKLLFTAVILPFVLGACGVLGTREVQAERTIQSTIVERPCRIEVWVDGELVHLISGEKHKIDCPVTVEEAP